MPAPVPHLPRRRAAIACGGLFLLCGCALGGCAGGPATGPLPAAPGEEALRRAREEVEEDDAPLRRRLTAAELRDTLARVEARLLPAARALCREQPEGRVCSWDIRVSRDRGLNAGAGERGVVVLNRGVFELAENDDQVAFVLGHEIGHQAAAHVATTRLARQVGTAMGVVLAGGAALAAVVLGGGGRASGRATRDITREGGGGGGRLGVLAFSRAQEREADLLALRMLHRAGFDPDAARGMLLTMARLSGGDGRQESGLFDTHPAGPERLAAFDMAARALRDG